MSGSQGFQSFQRSLRIGRPSWVASTWFAPADTVQKLVEQQNENGWLKIHENSKLDIRCWERARVRSQHLILVVGSR